MLQDQGKKHLIKIEKIIQVIYINKGVMVFNGPFNNISDISWRSVLLLEETGVPGENQTNCKSLTNFIT
jgi:hypothetical protein